MFKYLSHGSPTRLQIWSNVSGIALVLRFTTRDGLLQVSQPSQITDLLHRRNEWSSWKRRRLVQSRNSCKV